jgi:hypothetical protein
MKSDKVVLDHLRYGPMVSYRHRELERFHALPAAVLACDFASRQTNMNCCILDERGQEYFAGEWMS